MSLRQGLCHNCGCQDVYVDTANPIKNASNRLDLGFSLDGFFSTSHVHTRTYMCARCGLVERYVTDATVMQRVATHWQRVNGA